MSRASGAAVEDEGECSFTSPTIVSAILRGLQRLVATAPSNVDPSRIDVYFHQGGPYARVLDMQDKPSESAGPAPRIPSVIFLLLIVLLVITIAIAVKSCSSIKRTSWELAEPPSGHELQISVQVGGCDLFARTSVTETDETVVVEAYVRDDALTASGCDDGIFTERRTVQLQAPLGNRALQGCNPASAVYKLPYLSDSDCAASAE